MELVEYAAVYEEDVKDLLIELQAHIAALDREGYNILTDAYRESYFQKMTREVTENRGRIILARDSGKTVGFVAGLIDEEENSCCFSAPQSGRIIELIVTQDCRARGIGKVLLCAMEEYLRGAGCGRVLLGVFEYNEDAKRFYQKNGYSNRMTDMMKPL